MTAGLVLGFFDFANAGETYSTAFLGEGTSWGTPAPREAVVRSLVQDGSIVVTEGHDNREIVVRAEIKAPDSAGLAQGTADLFSELGKPNTLTLTSSDGWSVPTVFDVITSSLDPLPDDLAEVRGIRYYLVRLVCEPFGRSSTLTTVTPTPTSIGTARQQLHAVDYPGSARTEPAISVAHASASLGDVLVYSYPDDGSGYSPPLRQYLTSAGSTTSDSSLVSGARNMLDTPMVFDVPAETLPRGRALLMARVRGSGAGPVSIRSNVETRIGSNSLKGEIAGLHTFNIGTSWQIVVLGQISLPVNEIGDPTVANVRITLDDPDASGVDIDLDEAWVFSTAIGALTWVECESTTAASGGPSRRMYVLPPDATYNRPRVLRGHATDGSDAFYPSEDDLPAWAAAHMLTPGANKVLTVATNATTAVTSLSWYRHEYTHAVA